MSKGPNTGIETQSAFLPALLHAVMGDVCNVFRLDEQRKNPRRICSVDIRRFGGV